MKALLNLAFLLFYAGFGAADSYQTTVTRVPRKPVPKGLSCSASGKLAKAAVSYDIFVSTEGPLAACRDACFDVNEECVSFSVNSSNGKCRIYSKNLSAMGFKKGRSPGIHYYDKQCYEQQFNTVAKYDLTHSFDSFDDEFFIVKLPFPVKFGLLGSFVYNIAYMSVNGFIGLGRNGTSQGIPQSSWQPGELPQYSDFSTSPPSTYLPDTSVCGFWADLRKPYGQSDAYHDDYELSYTIVGRPPYRTIKFTWKAQYTFSVPQFTADQDLWMDMVFDEFHSGLVTVYYNRVGVDSGEVASIGYQNRPGPSNDFADCAFNDELYVSDGDKLVITNSAATKCKLTHPQ